MEEVEAAAAALDAVQTVRYVWEAAVVDDYYSVGHSLSPAADDGQYAADEDDSSTRQHF